MEGQSYLRLMFSSFSSSVFFEFEFQFIFVNQAM